MNRQSRNKIYQEIFWRRLKGANTRVIVFRWRSKRTLTKEVRNELHYYTGLKKIILKFLHHPTRGWTVKIKSRKREAECLRILNRESALAFICKVFPRQLISTSEEEGDDEDQ